MKNNYRHTKVVFTVGPSSNSVEMLERLITQGVDVCRFNMAHASHDAVRETAANVRQACKNVNRQISLLMDIKGPEIRTGNVPAPIELEEGQRIDFHIESPEAEKHNEEGVVAVSVNYPDIVNDIEVGSTVLVDSGLIRMIVIDKGMDRLKCRVLIPGKMGSKRHINLPGSHINLPSLTEKDHNDLKVAVELGFDTIALSFVRDAEAVHSLRALLQKFDSKARIVSKIEDQSGIRNLESIIAASDGIMVARGDLGIECPYEEIPAIQERMVKSCIYQGKPVIVATHMLESMIENPVPTRSEVSDVATAVRQKADCVMLSGESSVGKYPLECVRVLNNIARNIELNYPRGHTEGLPFKSPKDLMMRSAVSLAQDIGNVGILVFTKNGHLPKIISQLRPTGSPIFAFTDAEHIFRRMLPMWGVEPFLMQFEGTYEDTIRDAFERLLKGNWVTESDLMVVVTNVLMGGKIVDTIQLRPVSEGLLPGLQENGGL